ncbi:MAG: hypothetical protein FWF16_09755 [Microbacteriaceae bacterium]|nr:hypothetical protein [Microbacteriaceae bacterium]
MTIVETPVAASVTVTRLLAAGPHAGLAAHLAAFGAFDPTRVGPALVRELERSGLTGRGGAGFPAWRKQAATVDAAGRTRRPVLIANGAEGEPASSKDSVLLRNAPQLVLDGVLAAAAAIGAHRVYLYAGADELAAVATAIDERTAAGAAGAKDAARITLVEAADTFVSGEASAVVGAIERGTPLPRDHAKRLSTSGLNGRPTLLHNVETLAQVGLIARFGADWFRSVGTPEDPGTRLVTISGDVPATRVLEVAGGSRLGDVLQQAGCDLGATQAVLVGGYHGAWVGAGEMDARLSREGLAPFGASPGAGILVALSSRRCGLAATAQIVDYLAGQSAGQCGPCMFGLPAMAATWDDIANGAADATRRARLTRLAEAVDGRGACAHPDGTVRLSRSALRVFRADLEQHAHGRCHHARRAEARA